MRFAEYVTRMEGNINKFRILTRNPEGKLSIGSPRLGWENNIKTGLT
jgi:hypothetical protein